MGGGVGATLYAQDDSNEHTFSLTAGYDTRLSGYAAGTFASLSYGHNVSLFDVEALGGAPATFGARVGLLPHSGHLSFEPQSVAAGFEVGVGVRLPQDRWLGEGFARAGLLALPNYPTLQLDAALGASFGKRRSDDWGYGSRGPEFGITGVVSATNTGPSLGVWADVSHYQPLGFGVAEFALRTGYRQAPQLPLHLADFAAVGTLGYRHSVPAKLRYGDGLYALERVSLEPRLRTWFDGSLGVGADLSVNLDTVINYSAPLSFGATLGFVRNEPWYRFGVRLNL